MIVCHKYRYIFLKTTKTAGTSVEIALSRFCEDGDIITPISPVDEELRASLGGHPSQPYPAQWYEYHPLDWWRRLTKGKVKQRFYNHVPARKVRARLPADVWDNYYRFAIVRNPWDRVISQYFWRCRKLPEDQRPDMDEFLESSDVRSLMRKGFQLYSIGGQSQAHRLIRYENLAEELDEVRRHLGLPEALELPKAKGGHRTDRRHYREVLNEKQRDRIAELFRDELKITGYTF